MKEYLLLALCIPFMTFCSKFEQKKSKKVFKDEEIKLIHGNFKYTEGPVLRSSGEVYFADAVSETILNFNPKTGVLDTVLMHTGGACGLALGKDETLYMCNANSKKVSKLSKEGKLSVIAEHFKGGNFHGPNDLWVRKDGGLYFSDPMFGELGENSVKNEALYFISNTGQIKQVDTTLNKVNGVLGTVDEKQLYVTDYGDKKTWVYTIESNGDLSNKELFVEAGWDGIGFDQKNRLFMANKDDNTIDVYNLNGTKIDSVKVPEAPANLCVSENTVYITALKGFYSIRIN